MDSRSIEMRLRLPAPEEPAVLPPLILPTAHFGVGRAAPTIGFRRPFVTPADGRLVYAVLALLLLMLAVIVAGALKVTEDPLNPVGLGCDVGYGYENSCFDLALPEGWHKLAVGSLFPGDFTEGGIAYERVHLLVANVPVGGCASPGGPLPTSYESGGVSYQPRETADPGLACLRTTALPDGGVRLTAAVGDRSNGLMAADGPALQDTSEPSAEAGWTEVVDGRPARLVIVAGTTASGMALETRTWDILIPHSIDRILRVRAEIAGPDLEKGRRAVEQVLSTLRFGVDDVALDESDRLDVLRATLDDLDRGAREGGSDLYGCFPREPGTAPGTISAGVGVRLPEPVDVTCRTAIEASEAALWRIRLETTWPAGPGYAAGGRLEEVFVAGDGTHVRSFYWRLDGSPAPLDGEAAMLPMAPRELPPLLTGPLNLPVGSIVEMLYPGQYPEYEPNPANEEISPDLVGRHYFVVAGPRIVGGDEWYEVQSPDQWLTQTTWARGTFKGRPMLAVVEPACRSQPVEIDQLVAIPAYELLACLEGVEITLEKVIAVDLPPTDPLMCAFETDTEPTPCPEPIGAPAWLIGEARQQIFGPEGPSGPAPGLPIWVAPSAGSLPSGQWVRVRGHFDDAGASGCAWTSPIPQSLGLPRSEVQVLACREHFVVTEFEPVSAP